jgi:GNAT superfamily N-acetyltransferase
MSDITIEELTVPATIDDAGVGDFVEAVEVGNAVWTRAYGTPDLTYSPDEELPQFHNPYQPKRMFVARSGRRIVAQATLETSANQGFDLSWALLGVHPDAEGRGIGRALADAVEDAARAEGRTKIVTYVPGRDLDGARLASPTGFGSVSADARSTRFMHARGYTFEQVERMSRLPLPADGLDALFAAAQEATGPEYRAHTWVDFTPEGWREDRALLATRMSTDAPTAGLEEPEDVWTVERLLASEERRRDNPRRHLVAAAEHVPTGRLVGYTVLSTPRERDRAVMQHATLVLREHRGHRLGMLLKVANLAHLAEYAPGHPSILTFNAEENRPMLDVNEAVGFVPLGYEGAWRKDLR